MLADNFDLMIFDFDNTITNGWSDEFMPGVVEWFARLAENPRKPNLAIATNQGGVGLRYWMEADGFGNPSEYPTQGEVEDRLRRVLRKLPIKRIVQVYVCYAYQNKKSGKWAPVPPRMGGDIRWNPHYRKPAPGMLQLAMREALAKPERTLMVGDSDEDMLAAQSVGCHFEWAKDFFSQREETK